MLWFVSLSVCLLCTCLSSLSLYPPLLSLSLSFSLALSLSFFLSLSISHSLSFSFPLSLLPNSALNKKKVLHLSSASSISVSPRVPVSGWAHLLRAECVLVCRRSADIRDMPGARALAPQIGGVQNTKDTDDKDKREKVPKEARHHLDENPWIREYLDRPSITRASSSQQPSQPSSAGDAHHSGRISVHALEDDDVDELWATLAARRQAWKASEGEQQQHFTTQIRGGRWTRANLGTDADCVAASATKGEAATFCLKYSLPRMSSYSFAKYGEQAALSMAREWCQRMEHFFRLYLQGGSTFSF